MGAAMLPPWTCISTVTRWTPSCAAMAATTARWASWAVQPTKATHHRGPPGRVVSTPPGDTPV